MLTCSFVFLGTNVCDNFQTLCGVCPCKALLVLIYTMTRSQSHTSTGKAFFFFVYIMPNQPQRTHQSENTMQQFTKLQAKVWNTVHTSLKFKEEWEMVG